MPIQQPDSSLPVVGKEQPLQLYTSCQQPSRCETSQKAMGQPCGMIWQKLTSVVHPEVSERLGAYRAACELSDGCQRGRIRVREVPGLG